MKRYLLILVCFTLFLVPIFVYSQDQDKIQLENPLNIKTDEPSTLIGYVIEVVLGLVGGVALVMMVYGGFQWLTAGGAEEKIKNGTQTMLWSAIGLVLVFSSYLLVKTVLEFLK